MSNSFKLLFHLRKPKGYESGPQPIYLRITINRELAELATQRESEPGDKCWNDDAGRAKRNNESVRQLNAYLDNLVTRVYTCQNEVLQNGIPVTADLIKSKLSGKEDRSRILIPIFETHNKMLEELIGKEYSPTTLIRYKLSLQHTINFLKWKYSVSDIGIQSWQHKCHHQ